MKTLYFEGCGWGGADVSIATIGNCRCRTAFTNEKGEKIYLEIDSGYQYNKKNKKQIDRYWLHVSFCFYITDNEDDCNNSRISLDWQDIKENYDYSFDDILKFVNNILGCSFDEIVVLPSLSGYRVHADNKDYNFMEDYSHNSELIATRKELYETYYKLEKSEGKEFPNFSLWTDEENEMQLHLLRHYNGHNKHWTITINPSYKSWIVEETFLGKYAC